MPEFRSILVHVNTHGGPGSALKVATRLAAKDGAKLTLVDTIPDFAWPIQLLMGGVERTIELVTSEKSRTLRDLAGTVNQQGVEVTTRLLDGRLSVGIIREVMQDGHDLVIKQAKGRNSQRSGFFGTTATRLFRKCPCPVLATGPAADWPWRHIAAAVDVTPDDDVHDKLNAQIIKRAESLAASAGCPADIVSTWSVYGEEILKNHMREEELADLLTRAEADAAARLEKLAAGHPPDGVERRTHSIHGDPGIAIPRFLQQAKVDLLVMGTVGRAGMAGLMIGNTAERILDRAECSVLALKPEGFVSPIRPG